MNKLSSLVNWENPKKTEFLQHYKGVALLCSGGADSTALFADFIDFFKLKKIQNFFVFHVNFRLRGKESDGDEAFLKQLCESYQVIFECYQITEEDLEIQQGKSTQEWARIIRYREIQKFIDQGYCIALAHNLDDLAESTLMRMSRGTSLSALGGMKEWNPPYWRPLLHQRKSDILAYLKRKKLPFREDSSNAKINYSRNKIRHVVLPTLEGLHPNASERIARIATEAQEVSEYLRSTFSYENYEDGSRSIHLKKLSGFNTTVLKEYIVFLTSLNGEPHRTFNHKYLMEVIHRIYLAEKWSVQLPGGGSLEIKQKLLIFRPSVKRVSKAFQKHAKSFLLPETNIGIAGGTKISHKIPGTNIILILKNISSESYGLSFKQKEMNESTLEKNSWKQFGFSTTDDVNIQLGKLEYQCMIGEQKILTLNRVGVAYHPLRITIKSIKGSEIHAVIR